MPDQLLFVLDAALVDTLQAVLRLHKAEEHAANGGAVDVYLTGTVSMGFSRVQAALCAAHEALCGVLGRAGATESAVLVETSGRAAPQCDGIIVNVEAEVEDEEDEEAGAEVNALPEGEEGRRCVGDFCHFSKESVLLTN